MWSGFLVAGGKAREGVLEKLSRTRIFEEYKNPSSETIRSTTRLPHGVLTKKHILSSLCVLIYKRRITPPFPTELGFVKALSIGSVSRELGSLIQLAKLTGPPVGVWSWLFPPFILWIRFSMMNVCNAFVRRTKLILVFSQSLSKTSCCCCC